VPCYLRFAASTDLLSTGRRFEPDSPLEFHWPCYLPAAPCFPTLQWRQVSQFQTSRCFWLAGPTFFIRFFATEPICRKRSLTTAKRSPPQRVTWLHSSRGWEVADQPILRCALSVSWTVFSIAGSPLISFRDYRRSARNPQIEGFVQLCLRREFFPATGGTLYD